MDSEMWDARYADNELVWSREPNMFLPPLVDGLSPGTALDLACGEGRNAIWLAKQGWEVTGVDFSQVGVDKAKALSDGLDIEWLVGDATTFTSDAAFDLVVLFYLHLPGDETQSAFASAVGALKPGGTLFAVGHAVRNLTEGFSGPPIPELLWSVDRMASLIEELDIVEVAERERPVPQEDAVAIDLVVHATKPEAS